MADRTVSSYINHVFKKVIKDLQNEIGVGLKELDEGKGIPIEEIRVMRQARRDAYDTEYYTENRELLGS